MGNNPRIDMKFHAASMTVPMQKAGNPDVASGNSIISKPVMSGSGSLIRPSDHSHGGRRHENA
jgi:hypothetical protein